MPRSLSRRRKSPSRSVNRQQSQTSLTSKPKLPASTSKESKSMEFSERSQVLARWPGTNLYFKAKVTYVREDDNEYDVQYEDGTIFTIKARDVKKPSFIRTKTSRSRSRGRSPARRKSPSRSTKAQEEKAKPKTRKGRKSTILNRQMEDSDDENSDEEVLIKDPTKIKPKNENFSLETPKFKNQGSSGNLLNSVIDAAQKRTSARIAAKLVELSSDDDRPKLAPNPEHPKTKRNASIFDNLNLEWLGCLLLMVLGAGFLLSLHTLCASGSYKLTTPKIPNKIEAYWDVRAFGLVTATALITLAFSLLPVGSEMRTVGGHIVRKNGIVTLLACLGFVVALGYSGTPLGFVREKYFQLMVSSFGLGVLESLMSFCFSYFGDKSKANVNPKGNTNNAIVDFFNGRELNPYLWKFDLKLQMFRFSMISFALLNVALIGEYIIGKNWNSNPLIVLAAVVQVLYASDAMLYEDFYFFSHDVINAGFGYSMIVSHHSFLFLPTLITRYMLAKSSLESSWYLIAAVIVVNFFGYLLKHSVTISASSNKLLSEFSFLYKYSNYLGEALIQWSWVLPAVQAAGKTDLLVYCLPLFTTLVFLVRCSQQNTTGRRKYANARNIQIRKVQNNMLSKTY